MEIDKDLIRKVAKVARLDLSDQEVNKFIPQFKEVLEAFEVLRQADISGLTPAFHPVDIQARERKDIPKQGLTQEQSLSTTTHKLNGYFKGPKVMD